MRALVRSLMALIGIACASSSRPADTKPDVYHPPLPPGSSIHSSVLCECDACEPQSCCAGGSDEHPDERTCEDGYDFSGDGCGLEVDSCTGQCERRVWRVSRDEACDARRPTDCCGAPG